jgi:hypothetical protein
LDPREFERNHAIMSALPKRKSAVRRKRTRARKFLITQRAKSGMELAEIAALTLL